MGSNWVGGLIWASPTGNANNGQVNRCARVLRSTDWLVAVRTHVNAAAFQPASALSLGCCMLTRFDMMQATQVEFTTNGYGGNDFFDISLVVRTDLPPLPTWHMAQCMQLQLQLRLQACQQI